MSGGHFDYKQHQCDFLAEEIDELIKNNESTETDKFGDPIGFNYNSEIIDKFKEAVYTLRKAGIMAQRIDWIVSGDDGEEQFLKRWSREIAELDYDFESEGIVARPEVEMLDRSGKRIITKLKCKDFQK